MSGVALCLWQPRCSLILLQKGTLPDAFKSQLSLHFCVHCMCLLKIFWQLWEKIFKQKKTDHKLTLQSWQSILFCSFWYFPYENCDWKLGGKKKRERDYKFPHLMKWNTVLPCWNRSKEVESPSLSTAGALGILCCMRKACCTPHHCKIQRCWSTNVVRLLAGVWCHVKWQVWWYHTVQCSYQVADNTVSPVNSWGNPYPVIKKNASDFIKNL